jgi:ABC-type uncharacterized transport system substrate-binding protein
MRKLAFLLILCVVIFSLISCSKTKNELYTIGVFQFSNGPYSVSLDGVVDALEDGGYIDGVNCNLQMENAQGDFSTAQIIARKLVNDEVDLIITSTTPCLQVTAIENKTIPHVFGTVTDPFRMGIATSPEDHQPNLTGIGTFQPVAETIDIIREIIPELDNIGVVWNSAEACSEACTGIMREESEKEGFTLSEVIISSSNEVLTATRSLIEKNVDVIFVSGDNTVSAAIEAIINVADTEGIPVISNTPADVEKGVLLGLGADYYTVGYETGKLAIRVIEGEKTSEIPIQELVPKKLWLNENIAIKLGIEFPESVKQQADKIL